jgi:hypothetical protein
LFALGSAFTTRTNLNEYKKWDGSAYTISSSFAEAQLCDASAPKCVAELNGSQIVTEFTGVIE